MEITIKFENGKEIVATRQKNKSVWLVNEYKDSTDKPPENTYATSWTDFNKTLNELRKADD